MSTLCSLSVIRLFQSQFKTFFLMYPQISQRKSDSTLPSHFSRGFFLQQTRQAARNEAPDLSSGGARDPCALPPRDSSDVPATAALTLGEQRGAHGDKNDEQRVGKHGAHLARPSRRPHTLHGDKRSRAGERGTGKTLRGTDPREEHYNFDSTEAALPLPGHWPGTASVAGARVTNLYWKKPTPRVSGAAGARPGPVSRELGGPSSAADCSIEIGSWGAIGYLGRHQSPVAWRLRFSFSPGFPGRKVRARVGMLASSRGAGRAKTR